MPLLPVKSLSGSLPVLFIEARIQGPPEIVLSQMGISFDADKYNIALLMRTSGVLLVASIGSYMMYRVCTRLLGKDFIWTILEQARFDLLARDEKYLLNSKMSYISNDEYDDSCCSVELIDDEQSNCVSNMFAAISSSSHVNRTRQLCGRIVEDSKRQSEVTLKYQKRSTNMISQNMFSAKLQCSPNAGFSSSEKSASLHLLWDDPQWDEENDFYNYDERVDHAHSASSNVSDMTEFRVAKGLFEESNDYCKINNQDQTDHKNLNQEETNIDLETNDFIQKNCMVDSKHLYQITTGLITRTNSISVSSEHSSRSFPSLRQQLIANAASGGLLELAQTSIASSMVPADHMIKSMTDSGISRGTVSTSNWHSFIRSSRTKSAIGPEIFSSEDEEVLDMRVPCKVMKSKYSVIRRNNLNRINEDRCSTATSKQNIEWLEDDYCPFITDHDLKKSIKTDINDPLAECFSRSSPDQIFPNSYENRWKHMYKVTRDLMAWARDQFAPKSLQLKALQSLYISDQSWQRIGLKRSSSPLEQFLSSLLHLMFIRGIPFFNCSDMLIIAKAVRRAFSLYEFVQQWNFTDGSFKVENKEEHAIGLLQNLWDLQNGVKYLEDERFERYCIEAIRLLVLLWIVHCFEKTETGQWQKLCPNFYVELFGNNNPRQIIQSLYKTQLNNIQMMLLTDTLRIRLEVLDCSRGELDSEQPKLPRCSVPNDTAREITSRPMLTFLKFNRHNFLYPLLYQSLK